LKQSHPWRIAILLGFATVILLFATSQDIGLTWDEPVYIDASVSYTAWIHGFVHSPLTSLSKETIDQYWSINHEHPPAEKVFGGLVWVISRRVLDDLTAHRLGNIFLSGLLAVFLYVLADDIAGRLAGIASVAALWMMPRFFFHAHLAALDVPTSAALLCLTCLAWKARNDSRFRTSILLGFVCGIGFATKINAVFILPVFLLWALAYRRKSYFFLRILVATVIGCVLFIALWPWLYYDTGNRLLEFFQFMSVAHWKIPQFYLGQMYMPPPWHFPFVIVFAVVPLGTLCLAAIGMGGLIHRKDMRESAFVLLVSMLLPLLLLSIGQSMVFDNDRLMMPAFPFLACCAGIGFSWLWSRMIRLFSRWNRRFLTVAGAVCLIGAAVIPPVHDIFVFYPHLLSYYSEGVGGLPGAVRLGLETTYWCETHLDAVRYINTHAQPGDTIFVDTGNYDLLGYYQAHGILRADVLLGTAESGAPVSDRDPHASVGGDFQTATFVIVPYRQTSFFYTTQGEWTPLMEWARKRQPAYRLSIEGIPLMDIYYNR
jgi:4-amino-4-deoxy-L-arabinose transferase-like glycosyltransferase